MPQKYEIGLKLVRDSYVDLSSPDNLFAAKRGFIIFKWDDTVELPKPYSKIEQDESGRNVRTYHEGMLKCGAWKPWLAYRAGKWHNISKSKKYDPMTYRQVMKPMHMYWDDKSEFVEWIGNDIFKQLVVDLL